MSWPIFWTRMYRHIKSNKIYQNIQALHNQLVCRIFAFGRGFIVARGPQGNCRARWCWNGGAAALEFVIENLQVLNSITCYWPWWANGFSVLLFDVGKLDDFYFNMWRSWVHVACISRVLYFFVTLNQFWKSLVSLALLFTRTKTNISTCFRWEEYFFS